MPSLIGDRYFVPVGCTGLPSTSADPHSEGIIPTKLSATHHANGISLPYSPNDAEVEFSELRMFGFCEVHLE